MGTLGCGYCCLCNVSCCSLGSVCRNDNIDGDLFPPDPVSSDSKLQPVYRTLFLACLCGAYVSRSPACLPTDRSEMPVRFLACWPARYRFGHNAITSPGGLAFFRQAYPPNQFQFDAVLSYGVAMLCRLLDQYCLPICGPIDSAALRRDGKGILYWTEANREGQAGKE